jgi:hypothetical protein
MIHLQPDSIYGIPISLLDVILTTILGVIAIFGEQVRSCIFRPNLQEADNPIKTSQLIPLPKGDGCTYHESFLFYRLPIKNTGSASAKEVRVLMTYEKHVEDFIPVLLNWTHWNKSTRDISIGEIAYLDIFKKHKDSSGIEFCWASEVGSPVEPKLKVFDPCLGDFLLQFYERNSKVGEIKLRFSAEKYQIEIIPYCKCLIKIYK